MAGVRTFVMALALVALPVALVACGGTATSTTTPRASGAASTAPGASASHPTSGPEASQGVEATAGPEETSAPDTTESPVATELPVASESPETTEPPSASQLPSSPAQGSSDACSGSAENRDFFAAAAEAFTWDVYCAVVPEGWFLENGAFRLADGGRLEVSYKGPGGARIEIAEGAVCTEGGSACSPRDHELGPGRFGDLEGTLVTLGPDVADGFAIYVDPGAAPSWSIAGTGMDRASFEAIAAALHRVDG